LEEKRRGDGSSAPRSGQRHAGGNSNVNFTRQTTIRPNGDEPLIGISMRFFGENCL
jgi:hypothetical protein